MAFVPIYILILGFTIVIDYFSGIWIEKNIGRKRKTFLIVSLIANIGILSLFKYYNFFAENINLAIEKAGKSGGLTYLKILLPIGLSFHTFQAMSYTIEVYRGAQKAEKHFGIYALYVMFYPQLVAGPIERPQNLLHQFYQNFSFEPDRIISGLKQMLLGYLKKLVIADRISIYVNTIYNSQSTQSGRSLATATIFFAFQIYCDFSAYSDIAIGAARVMGFDLMTNFRRPYFAKSVGEFWRRWHISLSTWFKDYVYIPLGGSRVKPKINIYRNLMIVFFLSGIWHGANWTFIIWGMLNGFYLVIESFFNIGSKPKAAVVSILRSLVTFVLISFSWIFFRAPSVSVAFEIIKKILAFDGPLYVGNPKDHFYYGLVGIICLLLAEIMKENNYYNYNVKLAPVWSKYLGYALIVSLILLFGVFGGGQFIYFQF